MFLGHFAAGLAAKKVSPYTSLGTLLLCAQLLDLLWPTLVARGIEQVAIVPGITRVTPLDFVHYPWSHSLLMAVLWGALFAGGYTLLRRYPRGASVAFVLILSHWVLDVVVHRPDLPLAPGLEVRVGLGLWHSLPWTLLVEAVLFAIGLYVYQANTEPIDRTGTWALRAFALLLAAIYAANLFGPPPPSVSAIALVGHAQWLLVLAGYWIDRHRAPIRQW
ncbi:MAG TPA: hypothetical protein VF198_12180 [Vicinamibacterales bacterium]